MEKCPSFTLYECRNAPVLTHFGHISWKQSSLQEDLPSITIMTFFVNITQIIIRLNIAILILHFKIMNWKVHELQIAFTEIWYMLCLNSYHTNFTNVYITLLTSLAVSTRACLALRTAFSSANYQMQSHFISQTLYRFQLYVKSYACIYG